jgi:hypothetical protein
MPLMITFNLKPRLSGSGNVAKTDRGWMLSIPAGSEGHYRLAQLDDHLGLARRDYPMRHPLTLSLEARVSASALPGTWGFGLWNDPYGFSFGPGNGLVRLPALPNATWFFYSSRISHLSFREDLPANGFLAQVFSSPAFHPVLFPAAASMIINRRSARRLLARVIRENAARVELPDKDRTAWHRYGLAWTSSGTRHIVDGQIVLETPFSLTVPLGIVLWIDNQHAGFHPSGKITWGLEPNPEPGWLEIRDLAVSNDA